MHVTQVQFHKHNPTIWLFSCSDVQKILPLIHDQRNRYPQPNLHRSIHGGTGSRRWSVRWFWRIWCCMLRLLRYDEVSMGIRFFNLNLQSHECTRRCKKSQAFTRRYETLTDAAMHYIIPPQRTLWKKKAHSLPMTMILLGNIRHIFVLSFLRLCVLRNKCLIVKERCRQREVL